MKFELATFSTTLDTALVERGKKWYSEGMVQHVQNVKECIWNADIIGPNKQFKVQLEIVGKEVSHVFCNCGPKLCSHVVAFLFELVEKNYPTEKLLLSEPKAAGSFTHLLAPTIRICFCLSFVFRLGAPRRLQPD